jgi:hypothetical protein
MFPSTGSVGRRFASLHRVLRGEFPCFSSTIKALRLPAARLAALRFLRLAIPRCHSLFSLPGGRVGRQGLEFVTRYLRPGCCRGSNRISQVPGEPQSSVCHVPNRRRQDCLHQTDTVQQRGPWSSEVRGSHDWVFRRSIAWLSDSLFTLRRARYRTRRKTRFQLLVRLYWTGFSPARSR